MPRSTISSPNSTRSAPPDARRQRPRARPGRRRQAAALATCCIVLVRAITPGATAAGWQPSDVVGSAAAPADALAAQRRAAGSDDPAVAQRHERWTYVNGSRAISVSVAVRGDDFRTSLDLNGQTYTAGRLGGTRWRSDGNGISHGVGADLQGDPLDRAPQAVFALEAGTCTLTGEARLPQPAWVIATHRPGDKPAFLYIDEASGEIVREILRDGRTVVKVDFSDFEPYGRGLRARHWRVDDGRPADTLDVRVDAIDPGPVSAAEIARPAPRALEAAALTRSADFDARILQDGRFTLTTRIAGRTYAMLLDTGTASIIVAPAVAERFGPIALEHAVLPALDVGPLHFEHVSVLSVPDFGLDGILGLDFFFGHVVEIDFLDHRVRVLTSADGAEAFADPSTTTIDANVDAGLPLITAGFGPIRSSAFAVDTGSDRVNLMRNFMQRNAAEIARTWWTAGDRYSVRYLEGSIEFQPYRMNEFDFGGLAIGDVVVGGQVPSRRTDDLAVPFDGLIGTDILRHFDLLVDYDGARIGLRGR